jgi:hypothetical protein
MDFGSDLEGGSYWIQPTPRAHSVNAVWLVLMKREVVLMIQESRKAFNFEQFKSGADETRNGANETRKWC